MSWMCCHCGRAISGEPINAGTSEPQTRCPHCTHWTCENCGYAEYAEHYSPPPKQNVRQRTGGSRGVERCGGTVNEGVGWEKGIQRKNEDEGCCGGLCRKKG
jgi:hypothetical protein